MKRTTRPHALRDIQATRAEAAARAAARPKVKKRKRPKRDRPGKMATLPLPPPAPAQQPRGLDELAALRERLRLEPKVARRYDELADLASVMQDIPRGRR